MSGPGLRLTIERVDRVAADMIFTTAYTSGWANCVALSRVGEPVDVVRVEPHDGEEVGGVLRSRNLLDGINRLLSGGHVSNLYYEQALKDIIEWGESPEFGPPFDPEMCDIIVQLALFGEIKYG